MLRTRLWMGAILIVLTVGMLVGDLWLHPYYPFLFVFVVGLSVLACLESLKLLGRDRGPQAPVLLAGAISLGVANWLVHLPGWRSEPWQVLAGIFAGFVLAVFLYEMARFTEP